MHRFEANQRVLVVNPSRIATSLGQPAAQWLFQRLGAVRSPARGSDGAWIRMDDPLHPQLIGRFEADHPNGRNVLLFPWECELAHDHGYAPFHRLEFIESLSMGCARLDEALRAGSPAGVEERSWWKDVTEEVRDGSRLGLGEHVYRVGAIGRRVALLVYSSVSVHTQWSRSAGGDAIRFVHEIRSATSQTHVETASRVNRTGLQPLERVQARIVELLSQESVRRLLDARR